MHRSPIYVGHVSYVPKFRRTDILVRRCRDGRGRPSYGPHRRGLALLTAIVCIVVLSAMSVSLVRTVLARLHEAELHAYQLQADALAQSALDRGFAQRSLNPTYPGEVWTPVVSGSPSLKADIQWIDSPEGGTLRVVCLVPADAPRPVRVERMVPFSSPMPAKAE
jgi:hypothetical protein